MTLPPVRVVAQGQILQGAPEPPFLRLPDARTLFAERAARFDALAGARHPDADFLRMMGRLARAQQSAVALCAQAALPDPPRLALCREHGLPPLGKDQARDRTWLLALTAILADVGPHVPEAVQPILRDLAAASPDALERMADRLLALDYPALDPAAVPFLAAALQPYWVARAAALGEGAFPRLDVAGICPVCGMLPVASVLRIDTAVPGMRYLHCALCASDWHVVRGQCTQCDAREKVAYFHIESGSEAAKAEACEECRGYLKIFSMEKEPLIDPVADDLATLALDIMLDEAGYARAGPNLLFIPGQS